MTNSREHILSRLPGRGSAESRPATAAGSAPLLWRMPAIGETATLFRAAVEQMQGTHATVAGLDDVPGEVRRYLQATEFSPRIVPSAGLASLGWQEAGLVIDPLVAEDHQTTIIECFGGVAETGTLVVIPGPSLDARLAFAAEICIAIIREDQIVAGYEDIWRRLGAHGNKMPRAVNFITGPSRTADIEQTIELGAHGPKHLHIILVKS